MDGNKHRLGCFSIFFSQSSWVGDFEWPSAENLGRKFIPSKGGRKNNRIFNNNDICCSSRVLFF